MMFLATIMGWAASVEGQAGAPDPSPVIADNSFLLEEAYNQEAGVVQHISVFNWSSSAWEYGFTQEWPLGGQRHQLSLTLPIEHLDGHTGVGDMAVNYRLQVVGFDGPLAIAPRMSLVVPTGKTQTGHGSGGVGVQFNLPVSLRVHPMVVTHWNAGFAVTPSARAADGTRASTLGLNLGASAVLLVKPDFNILVETLWAREQAVVGTGSTRSMHTWVINPGVRWAHNFSNGLQIVPGLSAPLVVSPGHVEHGILAYLSFEHPL